MLKSLLGKAALATAALGGLLLFAGAPGAKANEWEDCNRRVNYTDYRLRQSIDRYGYYSREANHWRHERHEAVERCERYRRGHERREWREHRDWDRD
jgi:hypothetical protein